MAKEEKIMVTEHILEVRHSAVGSFLDVRGYVADYVRNSNFLPHWKIDPNVVSFTDNIEKVEKEGAFTGYKSLGYFTYNPPTKDFFQDRASAFLKLIFKNQHYKVPDVIRFGCRTKAFIPFGKDFESLNDTINQIYFSSNLKEVIHGKQTDLQIVMEFQEKSFNSRLVMGPMHKNEVQGFISFPSEHFSKTGLFIDLDFYKTDGITLSDINLLLKEAMKITWEKIDRITLKLGI